MVAMAVIVASVSCFSETSTTKIRQERNEIKRLAKKELAARVDRTTRKEVKRLQCTVDGIILSGLHLYRDI